MTASPEEMRIPLQSAIGGDATALQQLLLFYYPHIETCVRSQFNSQLAGYVEPDDLIQEVLIKVHRNLGSFQELEHGSFESWLSSIARNCVTDVARHSQRLKRGGKTAPVRSRPACCDQSLDTIWDWVCQDPRLPDRSVRRSEARQAIQVCLSQLPPAQREVVMAHYFDHLDANEIAVRLSRTPGAVRELLRRARERLGELMGSASLWLSNR